METAQSTLGGLFVDATSSKVKAATPNGAKARREIVASSAILFHPWVENATGSQIFFGGSADVAAAKRFRGVTTLRTFTH